MNQHLIWLVRRARFTFKRVDNAAALFNIFSSFLDKKVDLWMKRLYFPVTNMLEVEGITTGLILRKHRGGLRSQSCTNVKSEHRSLATDLLKQDYSHNVKSKDDDENRLINEWISNQLSMKQNCQEAVFVLGPMGAGKTTVLQEVIKKKSVYKTYAFVDTDELMEKLDGFDSERVDDFYPKARSIAIKLTDWLLNENISFVAEGTCVKYLELKDYMQRLKSKGYVIRVMQVNDISLDEILMRTSKRERKVSEDVVRSIYYGSLEGISKLKRINKEKKLFKEM